MTSQPEFKGRGSSGLSDESVLGNFLHVFRLGAWMMALGIWGDHGILM